MLYPCTFISCAQVRLEWLSSQQRTRAFYGELPLFPTVQRGGREGYTDYQEFDEEER